jgi:hypothetical protein
MLYDRPKWKPNWEQAQRHHLQWWHQEGIVLAIAGLPPLDPPRDRTPPPPEPRTARERHTDPHWFAWNQRLSLAGRRYPADNLPIAHVELGCVQLAACKQMMLQAREISRGEYLVGMPAFGSNLDVLAELRGTQNLLCDLMDRPEWVHQKLEEINQAFYCAFEDYYEQIRLLDGSSAYTYFQLWGPGKVSQVQCDFSAMISPAMFEAFVVPPLQRQCAWLDYSLFHLDGPSCICHLDALLTIPELDAVQWTPGAGQPGAGDATWYGLYERVLNAGKSVQILGVSVAEARRILDTVGSKGVYLSVNIDSDSEADEIIAIVESVR